MWGNPATPTDLAWPMTFPSHTGNEELLCEICHFLMSCHLSLLLTYVHPGINWYISHSVDVQESKCWPKMAVFSQKLRAANGIFLKSIRRKPAGTWHHSPEYRVGKRGTTRTFDGQDGEQCWGIFWVRAPGDPGVFSSLPPPPPNFWLTLETVTKEHNSPTCVFRCEATGYVSPDQPDSIFAAQ